MSHTGALAHRLIPRRIRRHSNSVIGVVDQGVSSATNLAVSILVASATTAEEFGAWGVVGALYLLEVVMVRGAVASPYTVRCAGYENDQRHVAIGTITSIAIVLSGLHLLAAALIHGSIRNFLLVYAFMGPGLLIQEVARQMLYANHAARRALESNVIWAVVQAALTIPAWLAGSGPALVLAWGLGGGAAACYCLRVLGVWPLPHGSRTWIARHGRLALSWSGDHLAQQGLTHVIVWTIGLGAGLSQVAAYRGATLLTGPATVVAGGVALVLLPAATRRARAADGSLRPFILRSSGLLGLVTALMLGPMLLIPPSVGQALLGDSWAGARRILPLIIAARVLNSLILGPSIGLRAVADYRRTLLLRSISGTAILVGTTIAASRWGAMGVAVVLLVVGALQLPAWLHAFQRGHETSVPEPDTSSADRRASGGSTDPMTAPTEALEAGASPVRTP